MAETHHTPEIVQPKHPVVIWIDDDREVHELARHRILQYDVYDYFFENFSVLTDPGFHDHLSSINKPILISIFTNVLPPHEVLRKTFDAIAFTGLITDLDLGNNRVAGIAILAAASSARFRPQTVLYSGRIERETEVITEALGINHVIRKSSSGSEGVIEVLLNLLGVQQHLPESRRLQDLNEELAQLRQENSRLKRERVKLRQEVKILSQRQSTKPTASKKAPPPAEDSTRLKERLAELEREIQMVSAHHHDLTNTSSFTVQALEQLINEPKLLPPVIVGEIERARISAKHCDVLVSSLTALTMRADKGGKVEPASVERALREALQIAERKIPPTVTVKSNIPAQVPLCAVPEHLLVRCVLNLILNSLEALPEGGRIHVSVIPPRGRSKYVEVILQDNGKGIKKLELPKIFEPNFSTKGKQHGFGLFIVKKVLDDFGGKVSVSSIRGRGAEVALKIPVA